MPWHWRERCSILKIAWRGSGFCARRGAACRSPICTLLTSADSPELLRRPVPELLATRMHLLSNEGRKAAIA